jgi:hypothetical protein
MRVHFESGGGVTGPAGNRSASFDTAQMPAPDAAELQRLVQAANLSSLVGRAAPASTRPDEMAYEITVEQDGRTQTISATQRTMPPELRPLMAWLNAHALRPV